MFRITSRTHGLLDYFVGPALLALPKMLNCSESTQRVLQAAGAGATAYSVVTDYERGVVKVLPMQAHLVLDATSGAGLIAAAMLLRHERPAVRALLAGIGAFEIAVASMTSTRTRDGGRSPTPLERVSHRVAEYV